MKTMMEVFYLRIIDDKVCYRRKRISLDNKKEDPDVLIQSLMQYTLHTSAGSVKKEFVIHSTSWRYTPPGKVMLTYIAYSDEYDFSRVKMQTLPIKELRKKDISKARPRSRSGLEKLVVAHAMRHIAFLIKTGDQSEFKGALAPGTRKIFKSLWVSLAGRVATRKDHK
jgi:hypothetical protein